MPVHLKALVVVATCCVLSDVDCRWLELCPNDEVNHLAGDSSIQRMKRTAPLAIKPISMAAYLGLKALKLFTSGTTKASSTVPNIIERRKQGDFSMAVEKFVSLNPQHVRLYKNTEGMMEMSGQVGDRTIDLITFAGRRHRSTTIQIYKTDDPMGERIIDLIRYVQ